MQQGGGGQLGGRDPGQRVRRDSLQARCASGVLTLSLQLEPQDSYSAPTTTLSVRHEHSPSLHYHLPSPPCDDHPQYAYRPRQVSDRTTAAQGWEERQRLVSSSTVIDHGSPPSSPQNEAFQLPELGEDLNVSSEPLFTKEEWLRLGDFMALQQNRQQLGSMPAEGSWASTVPSPSAPAAEPRGGVWQEFPEPTYSFPSTLQPFNPADVPPIYDFAPPPSPYDLPPLPPLPELPPTSPPLSPPPTHDPQTGDEEKRRASRPIPRGAVRPRKRGASSTKHSARTRAAPYPSSSSTTPPPPTIKADTPLHSDLLDTFALAPAPALPPAVRQRKSHARKSSPGHVPRPRNAFILFRSHAVSTNLIPKDLGIRDHKSVSQVVAAVWRGFGAEEKRQWEELAEQEKREHREKYPDYTYKPKTRGPRKPVGTGKKALAKKARLDAEGKGSDEEMNVVFVDDSDYHPKGSKKTQLARRAAATTFEAKELAETHGRRMQLMGQALLEGEASEVIPDRVKLELAIEEEMGVAPPPKPTKATRASRRLAAAEKVNTPPPPLPSSSSATPRTARTSTRSAPYTSPKSSDILVNSPGGSTLTTSPTRNSPHRSSKLAYRDSASVWAGQDDSTPAPSSPNSSPQRHQLLGVGSSPVKSPLSKRVGPRLPSIRHGYGQLGVHAPSSSPFDSPRAPQFTLPPLNPGGAPFLAGPGFVNSPLFNGGGTDRKSSLGRWELRKPSATMSRREMRAQEEEDKASREGAGGRIRSVSKAFTIDPRLFLAEAGLAEEEEPKPIQLLAPTDVCTAPSRSSHKSTYPLPTIPDPAPYHFAGQDLFTSPADLSDAASKRLSSIGSAVGDDRPPVDYESQLESQESPYSPTDIYGPY